MDFIGLQKVDGEDALFQISGAPPKCLYCKTFGHMRKECPKLKTKCSKCNKTGHESSSCTIANRIASDNNANSALQENDELVEIDVNEHDKEISTNPLLEVPFENPVLVGSHNDTQDPFKVPQEQDIGLTVKKEKLKNAQSKQLTDAQKEKKAKDKEKREEKKKKIEEEAKDAAIKKAEQQGKKKEDFLREFELMNAQARRECLGLTIKKKAAIKQPASSDVGGATSKSRGDTTTDAESDLDFE